MNDQPQNKDPKQPTDRELEIAKLYQDTFKHLMTFCAAAIGVAATVSGAFFPNPPPGASISLTISLVCLFVGVALSLDGLRLVHQDLDPESPIHREIRSGGWSPMKALVLSTAMAFVGVMLFTGFIVGSVVLEGVRW